MQFYPWKILIASITMSVAPGAAYAFDSTYVELAAGDKVQMVGVGAQWNWERRWFQSRGSHVGGHWDLTLAHWRGTAHKNMQGETQPITSVGITPVWRFQQDSKKGFYAEAGVGVHLLSDLYDNNNKRLSTALQFGDHLGIGYVFDNKLDIGLRLQHFSNGGIKEPNDGINFAVVRASYAF